MKNYVCTYLGFGWGFDLTDGNEEERDHLREVVLPNDEAIEPASIDIIAASEDADIQAKKRKILVWLTDLICTLRYILDFSQICREDMKTKN